MICIRCGTKMKVTHTYAIPGGQTSRVVCPDCGLVGTSQTLLVATDPKRGQGAASLASRMKKATVNKTVAPVEEEERASEE